MLPLLVQGKARTLLKHDSFSHVEQLWLEVRTGSLSGVFPFNETVMFFTSWSTNTRHPVAEQCKKPFFKSH